MTIRDISRDKYYPTIVKRAAKTALEATIVGLPYDVRILESAFEWRLISEIELANLTELAVGIVESQGTSEWTINRRSIPVGISLVIFIASYTTGDPASPQTLRSFNYGFIKVIPAPVKAVIVGGNRVRWGSVDIVTVNGSLSYDEDIGPGNYSGLSFAWSCFDSEENVSVSNNCSDSFHGLVDSSSTTISINPGPLQINKTYVLRLNVSKDERSSHADISFEVVNGRIPLVALR